MSVVWPIPEEQRRKLREAWEQGLSVEEALRLAGIAEKDEDFARSFWLDFDIFARINDQREAEEAARKRALKLYRVSVMWGRGPKSTRPVSWDHFGMVRPDGAVFQLDEIDQRGGQWRDVFFMTLREAVRLVGPVKWSGNRFEEQEGTQDFGRGGFFARRELCPLVDLTPSSRTRLERYINSRG